MNEFDFNKLWVGQKIFDLMFGWCTITKINPGYGCDCEAKVDNCPYETILIYGRDGDILTIADKDSSYSPGNVRRTIAFRNPDEQKDLDLYGVQPVPFVAKYKQGERVYAEDKTRKVGLMVTVEEETETGIIGKKTGVSSVFDEWSKARWNFYRIEEC